MGGGGRTTELQVVAFVLGAMGVQACGTRRPLEDAMASCAELAMARVTSAPCASGECEWVWIVDRGFGEGSVLNLRESRLNGLPGAVLQVDGEHWHLFDDVALRVDTVSDSTLQGTFMRCTDPTSMKWSFSAEPLAPYEETNEGVEVLAQLDVLQGDLDAARGSDLTLLDENTLTLALGAGGLSVVDISAVSTGRLDELARIPAPLGDDYNDVVAVEQRYVFAASKRQGLSVWDLSNPRNPTFVTDRIPERAPRDGHNLLVRGDTLYLAQAPVVGTGALAALDVSEPTRPTEIWRFVPDQGHDVHDVSLVEDRVYVSSLRGGVYVLQLQEQGTKGEHVKVLARATVEAAHNVALLPVEDGQDRFLLSTERLWGDIWFGEFDPHSASGPTLLATSGASNHPAWQPLDRMAASPHNIECVRSLCFVAHYQLGLRVFDWSAATKTQPRPVAAFQTWQPGALSERDWLRGASGVLITPSVVYVLDTQAGLFALRTTYGN